jgi:hypothetical protein
MPVIGEERPCRPLAAVAAAVRIVGSAGTRHVDTPPSPNWCCHVHDSIVSVCTKMQQKALTQNKHPI